MRLPLRVCRESSLNASRISNHHLGVRSTVITASTRPDDQTLAHSEGEGLDQSKQPGWRWTCHVQGLAKRQTPVAEESAVDTSRSRHYGFRANRWLCVYGGS